MGHIAGRDNFASLVAQSLEGLEIVQPDLLMHLTKQLKLSVPVQIMLAVSLANSTDRAVMKEGTSFFNTANNY